MICLRRKILLRVSIKSLGLWKLHLFIYKETLSCTQQATQCLPHSCRSKQTKTSLVQQEGLFCFILAFFFNRSLSNHHFSSKSTSMIWDLGGFLEFPLLLLLLLLSLEKKSPCGCHTMFLQPSHLMIWFLYPMNCLLHAGHSPYATPNDKIWFKKLQHCRSPGCYN